VRLGASGARVGLAVPPTSNADSVGGTWGPVGARGAPNLGAVCAPSGARRVERVLTPIVIDDVHPRTPGGFPAKAVCGLPVTVSAQVVADGHDLLSAQVRWRRTGGAEWAAAPL